MLNFFRRVDWLPIVSAAFFYVLAVELLSSFGFPEHDKDKRSGHTAENGPLESWWPSTAEEWTAFFTFTLTASTIALWWVTFRISRDAKQNSERQLRAFIFADGVSGEWQVVANPTPSLPPSYCWTFRPVWKNSGSTPTKELRLYTDCEIRQTPLPVGFGFQERSASGLNLMGPNSIIQGGAAPRPPDSPITPQDIVDAQNGIKFIYLWGWARYSDVFLESERHVTRFCWLITSSGNPFQFLPSQNPQSASALRFGYVQHTEGNCADEECEIAGLA